MRSLLIAIAALLSFQAANAQRFNSTTLIDPKKSFVLGEGKHGSYKALVLNNSTVPVSIYTAANDSAATMVTILAPQQQELVAVAANQKAIFKNESDQRATIRLQLTTSKNTGNLSMTYSEN